MVSAKKVCSLLRVLNLHIIRNHVIETILTHAFVNFNQPNQEGVGAGGGGGECTFHFVEIFQKFSINE